MQNTVPQSYHRNEDNERASTGMLSAALDLHERGFVVIPLKPRSKLPLVNWKKFQTRKPTLEQIKDWFIQEPEMNIGILTGAVD